MPGTIVRCQEMEIQREKYREYFFFLSLCVGSELLRELLSELFSLSQPCYPFPTY